MNNEEKRIVEINGVKLEIDLRSAQTIESYRIGDPVKILIKSYGESYTSHPGTIVGFDNFTQLPTIIVAYLDTNYNGGLKLAYINAKSEGVEICPRSADLLNIEKERVVDLLNLEIQKALQQVADLKAKKEYFLKYFGIYFEETQC